MDISNTYDDVFAAYTIGTLGTPHHLSSGYWHVALDKESSLLTTVQTPFGRYRRCHLPFGTCASAEIFRKKLIDALERLPVVMCIAHDVLIHGNTTEDHDQNLECFSNAAKRLESS